MYTEDWIEIGRLDDIIFMVSSNPKVSKLLINTYNHDQLILPFEYVIKMNNSIVIKKSYMAGELIENELYIKKTYR